MWECLFRGFGISRLLNGQANVGQRNGGQRNWEQKFGLIILIVLAGGEAHAFEDAVKFFNEFWIVVRY